MGRGQGDGGGGGDKKRAGFADSRDAFSGRSRGLNCRVYTAPPFYLLVHATNEDYVTTYTKQACLHDKVLRLTENLLNLAKLSYM